MKLNKNTAGIIFISSLLLQLVIIIYNHLTGYIQITGMVNFLVRLIYSSVLTFTFGLILVYADLKILNKLDEKLTWHDKAFIRLLSQTITGIISGAFLGSSITIISHALNPYSDGLVKNLVNNSLITIVINFIVISALEAVLFFQRNREASIKAERLEKENIQIQMETLKNQLNPHFLFNSLNVLSALVGKDSDKAQNFIEEFSSVYRYVLDVFDKTVVELRDELAFAKSYLYLQKIRFEDSVIADINIEASQLGRFIPPLAVQTILENAFKHNKATKENPLFIKIYNDEDFLYITNNLQPKHSGKSSGIGLSNLKKRYNFLTGAVPKFNMSAEEYTAELPLIKAD